MERPAADEAIIQIQPADPEVRDDQIINAAQPLAAEVLSLRILTPDIAVYYPRQIY